MASMVAGDPLPALLDDRTPVRYRPGLPTSLTPPLVLGEPVQTVLGEAIPLDEVSFVVVDLETTGGSPVDDAITEIGAVRFEGAERVGTFQTLVDPERPIPPAITHLTGIERSRGRRRPVARDRDAVVPRVRPWRRDRRAQRVVRRRLPEREPLAAGVPDAAVTGGVHREARAAVGVARGRERPPAHARELLPYARPAEPSRIARRRSHRRGVPGTPRRRPPPRHPHARRAVPRLQRAGAAELREDRARRGAAPRARGLRLPRPQRPDPLRGQGEGRARPGEVLFLRGRTQEGAGPRRVGHPDRRDRDRRRAGGARPREPTDRPPPSAVQRARQAMAPLRLLEARPRRGVAALEARTGVRSVRRRRVPRAVRLVRARGPREGGTRGGLPRPQVHAVDGSQDALRTLRARRHGPVSGPVRWTGRAGRLPRGGRRDARRPPNPRRARPAAGVEDGRPRRSGAVRGGGARP